VQFKLLMTSIPRRTAQPSSQKSAIKSLIADMRTAPVKIQIEVFTKLVRKLQRLQRQLHVDYRKACFLCDRIVMAADLPDVAKSLRENVILTSQEAQQRISAPRSSDIGSAGRMQAYNSDYSLDTKFSWRRTEIRGKGMKKARDSPREVHLVTEIHQKFGNKDAGSVGARIILLRRSARLGKYANLWEE
jgi:hypothetical protein